MTDTINTVIATINRLLEEISKSGGDAALQSHLDILTASEGTDEEKLRKLSEHTTNQILSIIDNAGPVVDGRSMTDEMINAMSAHMFIGDLVASILKGLWQEKVIADAKA